MIADIMTYEKLNVEAKFNDSNGKIATTTMTPILIAV